MLEHVAERRGGVGHRVGAMQDDEAVVPVVVVNDDVHHVGPVRWIHVGGVQRRGELDGVEVDRNALQLGHVAEQVAEVDGLVRTGGRILDHADGAAGVDDQYMRQFGLNRIRRERVVCGVG